MKLESDSFAHGDAIPTRYAFGKHHPEDHFQLADNVSPHFAWSDLPAGTKSLCLICHDPDVPSRPDDVNQEGKVVPADLPRVDFFHWVLVDLPADATALAEGEFSSGVTAAGKDGPSGGPRGTRQGANNYTEWFAGDESMGGTYHGYDGPAPPWNDSIVHHYHFTLYALDVERVPLDGDLTGPEVRAAIEGHVLGSATHMGTYTINADAVDRG